MAGMIIDWFQGVYVLTEVKGNMAVIDMHSILWWHSSSSAWECLTAANTTHYLRNLCSVQSNSFPLFSGVD